MQQFPVNTANVAQYLEQQKASSQLSFERIGVAGGTHDGFSTLPTSDQGLAPLNQMNFDPALLTLTGNIEQLQEDAVRGHQQFTS